jgi:hypothetical protein
MVRYVFDMATPADDAQLRQVLRETPMESSLATVTYETEPSFFQSSCPDGAETDVIICRDTDRDAAVGFGCRSIREMFVNGKETRIGYLSTLRCIPKYRNQGLVGLGYRAMKKLHDSTDPPEWYFSTILEGNQPARHLLTSGRAGLPYYHSIGRYSTFLIPVDTLGQSDKSANRIERREAQQIVSGLSEIGSQYQLFPCYQLDGWLAQCEELYDGSFFVTTNAGKWESVMGVIDQRSAKQLVIKSYPRWLQCCRYPLNCWYKLRGQPVIHKPPYDFKYLTAILPLVDSTADPDCILPLLGSVLSEGKKRVAEYIALGMHESHKSYQLVKDLSKHTFNAEVFLVSWKFNKKTQFGLDDRPIYLELGWL